MSEHPIHVPPIVPIPPPGTGRGGRPQIALEIDKNTVTVVIRCSDRYAAMELYDRLVASAREGLVEIEIPTVPK